jgi:hypothetical protein
MDSLRIISCPVVAFAGDGYWLSRTACFDCAQNFVCRELIHRALVWQRLTQLLPYKTIIRKQMCNPPAVDWMQLPSWRISKTLGWDVYSSPAISCELLHGCRSTTATTSTSLIGVRAKYMSCVTVVSLSVSRCRYSYRRHAVASGWRHPRKQRVPIGLLRVPRVRCMSQCSSSVCIPLPFEHNWPFLCSSCLQ